jgi:hypothetical protein
LGTIVGTAQTRLQAYPEVRFSFPVSNTYTIHARELVFSNDPITVDWDEITGKPSTFPPEAHVHDHTDIAGLGSSAVVNTGTSGATIPLLNGTNTWSGVQTFAGATNPINTTTEYFGSGITAGTGGTSVLIGQGVAMTGTGHSDNVVIGYQAFVNATNGADNVVIGRSAGVTSSARCVVIGDAASSSSASDAVVVGQGLSNTVASAVVVGRNNTSSGGIVTVGSSLTNSLTRCISLGNSHTTLAINEMQFGVVGSSTHGYSMRCMSRSSTSGRSLWKIEGAFIDSTDATYKGRMILGVQDAGSLITGREGIRIDSNGSTAQVGIGGAVSANSNVLMVNGTAEMTNLRINSTATAPATGAYTGIAGTFYGANENTHLMTPDAWLPVNRNGTAYKIPLYL